MEIIFQLDKHSIQILFHNYPIQNIDFRYKNYEKPVKETIGSSSELSVTTRHDRF